MKIGTVSRMMKMHPLSTNTKEYKKNSPPTI